MMTGFTQDVRYALRQLGKAPGFAAVAIITLALGIGANTAIFSLLDQALLRTLPVKDADRLVILQSLGSFNGHTSSRTDENFSFSYPMYRDLRDGNSVFSGLIATDKVSVGVQWHNQPELVDGELVSGNYFDVLGVQPARGRLLVASDDVVPDANPVAVLSFSYWQRRFGSDFAVVNQSILINGRPFTVLGVAPPGFHSVVMGDTPDLFVPMSMKAEIRPGVTDLLDRTSRWLNIVGKLKPGLTREQAEAGINPLWYSIRADELKQRGHSSEHFKESFLTKSHLFVRDGAKGFSPLRADVQEPLVIIMGMVGLVALMACANVGSLLLVRAAGRIREMSVRYALGAKRARVVQQLLVEGLLLGLAGGALGILIAPRISAWLINMIWSRTAGDLPFSSHPDLRILVFNFSLALLVSLIFSLAPAVQFWRPNLAPALKQQAMTASGGPLRFRRLSVAVQIGLSILVLVGAGLFVRTLHNLKSLNVGFETDHLVTFGVQATLAGYRPDQTRDLDTRILQTLAALPGVRSVAGTTDRELADTNTSNNITLAGGKIWVTYVKDATSMVKVFQPDGKLAFEPSLPALGSIYDVQGRWENPAAYFTYASYAIPATVYRSDMATGKQSVWAQVKVPVDGSKFEVKQIWYASKDGTKVPMFLLYAKGVKLDGTNPALLEGYGGFAVNNTPFFNADAIVWAERGGVYALANIRGGGEFGEAWHKAGMLDKKQNVFDDFIGV